MTPDYEGYEELSRFTPARLQLYRQMLMEKTKPQVDFILKHIPRKRPLAVFEIGTGNGRLLIGLARARDSKGDPVLESGYGIDTSVSRILFARDWCAELQCGSVIFACRNVLDTTVLGGDLAVCITGCFQYFTDPKEARAVLDKMRRAAEYSLFELYQKPPMGRTWKELPSQDPWEFLLDEYVDKGAYVEHRKIFVGSAISGVDIRGEHLKYYTLAEFGLLLTSAGYTKFHWAAQDSEKMVVLAS